MIRCQAFQDPTRPVTHCWNDRGHAGDHRWFDSTGWVYWPQTVSVVDRIRGKVGL